METFPGNLPELDTSKPFRLAVNIRPEHKAFITSLSAGNFMTETDVVGRLLDIARTLGRQGIGDELMLPPRNEGEPAINLILGINLSVGASSLAEYQALRAK